MKRTTRLERRTELRSDPGKVREFVNRGQQATARARKPRAISPASKAQRLHIAGRSCIVTGAREGVQPAHVTDRSLGGCNDALCVVPLRADIHRLYDDHRLDLLPYLEGFDLRDELAHAVIHLGLLGALQRITGVDWAPLDAPPRLAA